MKYFASLLLTFCFLAAQAQKLPMDLESFRSLPAVGSPVVSPDGQYLLYTVTTTEVETNGFRSSLVLLNLERNQAFELARNVADPQWSPDGKWISYRSSHAGKSGIFKAMVKITNNKASLDIPVFLAEVFSSDHFLGHQTVKNYAWSPDGKYLAYVSADPATCKLREDPNDPLEIERTLYKTRTDFTDHCITRVYLVSYTGKPEKVLTPDSWDSHSISWSPDSKFVSFLANPEEDPDMNYNNELWKVQIESGELTRLSETVGTEHEPVWNPRYDRIAFPATVRPLNTKDSPPENTFIYSRAADGTDLVNLTRGLDRRATTPRWHPDGEWLYFIARNYGQTGLYRVRPGEDPQPVILKDGSVGAFSLAADKVYFAWNEHGKPTEIYKANLDGTAMFQVTQETYGWISDKQQSKMESFWFDTFDGKQVQGFIVYPPNLPVGKKIPLIHRIHGGPHGMYGFAFTDINEMLAAKGYAVLMVNPRGSTGYGQQFADGTYQAWGGADYKDLMAGLDAALLKYPFIDADRMAVTGGSYGGFMTNWVVTQTDRYKAAVTVASLSNLISFYGTSLYQLLIETEFNGLPWENYDLLWHFSPLRHVAKVKTPTLLLHGEKDNDVPITQAEEFYIALKKLGVPTRFVRYPNEGHSIRQPRHREHYHKEMFHWFERYLR